MKSEFDAKMDRYESEFLALQREELNFTLSLIFFCLCLIVLAWWMS